MIRSRHSIQFAVGVFPKKAHVKIKKLSNKAHTVKPNMSPPEDGSQFTFKDVLVNPKRRVPPLADITCLSNLLLANLICC